MQTAGGAHALFQQPRFVIEAVRVGVAVRALQAHDKAPALDGLHEGRIGGAGAVPGQDDLGRHGSAGRVDMRGVELEAHAAIEAVRQARDDAGHRDIVTFSCARQCIAQRNVGKKRCPAGAEQNAGNQHAGHAAQDHANDDGRNRAGCEAGCFRQCGPGLEPGSARGEGKDGAAHGLANERRSGGRADGARLVPDRHCSDEEPTYRHCGRADQPVFLSRHRSDHDISFVCSRQAAVWIGSTHSRLACKPHQCPAAVPANALCERCTWQLAAGSKPARAIERLVVVTAPPSAGRTGCTALRDATDQGVTMRTEVRFGRHADRKIRFQTGRKTGPKVIRIEGRDIGHAIGRG